MGGVTDPSPVRYQTSFPDFYTDAVKQLQNHFHLTRAVPTSTKDIHSPLCITLKPFNEEETHRFIQYTCSVIRVHFEIARITVPISMCQKRLASELLTGQCRFCIRKRNDMILKRILVASL